MYVTLSGVVVYGTHEATGGVGPAMLMGWPLTSQRESMFLRSKPKTILAVLSPVRPRKWL